MDAVENAVFPMKGDLQDSSGLIHVLIDINSQFIPAGQYSLLLEAFSDFKKDMDCFIGFVIRKFGFQKVVGLLGDFSTVGDDFFDDSVFHGAISIVGWLVEPYHVQVNRVEGIFVLAYDFRFCRRS